MLQRRETIVVGNGPIGAMINENLDNPLVHRPSVRENHGLHQRGPSEPIDMVDIDVGRRQQLHHAVGIPVMASGDEGGSAKPIRQFCIGSSRNGEPENLDKSLGTGVQERIVAETVLDVDIRTCIDQKFHNCRVVGLGRRHHGGPSKLVDGVQVSTAKDQF